MGAEPFRIMIAEDEPLIALMLEDILGELGYRVQGVAATMDDAMALAAEPALDGAILDCNLGGGMVWPVAARLRARSLPFLFATGGGSVSLPPEFRDAPHLPKPYTMTAVAQALERLLACAR
jgi:DNA-binding response OmpR family regulator